MNEEELKKKIKERRQYRLFEISDDIFERYKNGEANLTENLFNEFKELLQRTTDIENAKAELKGFQKGKLEERERILELIEQYLDYWGRESDDITSLSIKAELNKLTKEIGGNEVKE